MYYSSFLLDEYRHDFATDQNPQFCRPGTDTDGLQNGGLTLSEFTCSNTSESRNNSDVWPIIFVKNNSYEIQEPTLIDKYISGCFVRYQRKISWIKTLS